MKQFTLLSALLLALLLGCTQAEPAAPSASLLISDGESEQSYTVDDLQALGAQEATFREVAYKGVPLAALLKDAGYDAGAIKAVKATAVDGFSVNYDPDLVNLPDTLVAYAQVDGPLGEEDGTFRMVLPDQEGKLNPRDLVELTVYR